MGGFVSFQLFIHRENEAQEGAREGYETRSRGHLRGGTGGYNRDVSARALHYHGRGGSECPGTHFPEAGPQEGGSSAGAGPLLQHCSSRAPDMAEIAGPRPRNAHQGTLSEHVPEPAGGEHVFSV